MLGLASCNNPRYAKRPCVRGECRQSARPNPQTNKFSMRRLTFRGTKRRRQERRGNRTMVRNLVSALALLNLLFAGTARAQQLDTSMSDKQIVANILKEC